MPRLDRALLRFTAAEEADLSIAFETSLLAFAETSTSLVVDDEEAYRARGRVVRQQPGRLVIANGYGELLQIRMRIPSALDLDPLAGSVVSLEVSRGANGVRPAMNAVLRDAHGGLLLWARDGELPRGRGPMAITVQGSRDLGERTLLVAGGGTSAHVASGATADLLLGRTVVTFAALRVADRSASFFVVRT